MHLDIAKSAHKDQGYSRLWTRRHIFAWEGNISRIRSYQTKPFWRECVPKSCHLERESLEPFRRAEIRHATMPGDASALSLARVNWGYRSLNIDMGLKFNVTLWCCIWTGKAWRLHKNIWRTSQSMRHTGSAFQPRRRRIFPLNLCVLSLHRNIFIQDFEILATHGEVTAQLSHFSLSVHNLGVPSLAADRFWALLGYLTHPQKECGLKRNPCSAEACIYQISQSRNSQPMPKMGRGVFALVQDVSWQLSHGDYPIGVAIVDRASRVCLLSFCRYPSLVWRNTLRLSIMANNRLGYNKLANLSIATLHVNIEDRYPYQQAKLSHVLWLCSYYSISKRLAEQLTPPKLSDSSGKSVWYQVLYTTPE